VIQPGPAAGKATFILFRSDRTTCANWGAYGVVHVGANALSIRRPLLQFDLSGLASGRTIRSATLSLYSTTTIRGSGLVNVHRLAAPWAEGTGVNTCTNDGATWDGNGLGTPWQGGVFDPTPSGFRTKHAGEGPRWDTFGITTLVRRWASGEVPNYGVVLKLANEGFSPCTTVTNCNYWPYASDDYPDASLRPKLTVTYDG
jgi:hypothetical protein